MKHILYFFGKYCATDVIKPNENILVHHEPLEIIKNNHWVLVYFILVDCTMSPYFYKGMVYALLLPITLNHYSRCILHTNLCHLSFYLSIIVYLLNKKTNTCLLNKYDVWCDNPLYFLRQVIFVYILMTYTLYACSVII